MGKKENPIREFLTWAVTSWLWDVGKTIFSVIGAYFSSRIPQVSMLTQFFSPWIIQLSMGFIFYGLVQFITDILNFLVVDKMLLINKQRSKGVELKSKHFEIETPEQSTDWVNKFDEWDAETARIIKRFDPAYAEYFKYIDTYKMTSPTTKGFDEKQQRKINALKEKLARIEKYYEQERNR